MKKKIKHLLAALNPRAAGRWASRDASAARHACRALTQWNHFGICSLTPEGRDMFGQVLADAVNAAYPYPRRNSDANPLAAQIREEGCAGLGSLLTPDQARETADFFRARPCFNSHVYGEKYSDGVARNPLKEAREFRFGSYPKDVSLQAPHLLEALLSERVLDAVEGFLGAPPMLFSVNTFWSFPQNDAASYGQDYHRDISHSRLCVLFIYLTNTDQTSGAHQYLRKTHSPQKLQVYLEKKGSSKSVREFFELPMDGLGFTDLYERNFGELAATLTGLAGTGFLEDGYGLHRGLPPVTQPRLVCWARYSLFTEPPELPMAGRTLLGERYPRDERARYALRGVVA